MTSSLSFLSTNQPSPQVWATWITQKVLEMRARVHPLSAFVDLGRGEQQMCVIGKVSWCGYVSWLLHDLIVNMVYTQLTVGSVHLHTHTQDLILFGPI